MSDARSLVDEMRVSQAEHLPWWPPSWNGWAGRGGQRGGALPDRGVSASIPNESRSNCFSLGNDHYLMVSLGRRPPGGCPWATYWGRRADTAMATSRYAGSTSNRSTAASGATMITLFRMSSKWAWTRVGSTPGGAYTAKTAFRVSGVMHVRASGP